MAGHFERREYAKRSGALGQRRVGLRWSVVSVASQRKERRPTYPDQLHELVEPAVMVVFIRLDVEGDTREDVADLIRERMLLDRGHGCGMW